MTKELNVFHLGKQPWDSEDQTFEVNLIEGLTSEYEEELEYEPEYEFELGSDDFNLDQIVDSAVEWATTPTPTPTPLSLEPIDLLSTEKYSFSKLKALPDHLKYVYLGGKETLPIIIASHLTEEQEEVLLGVMRENKEVIGWTMADIKGLSTSVVQHCIHLIEEAKLK